MFKLKLLSKKTEKFFVDIILENIKLREENKVVRHDLLHLLLEARKTPKNAKEDDPKAKLAGRLF